MLNISFINLLIYRTILNYLVKDAKSLIDLAIKYNRKQFGTYIFFCMCIICVIYNQFDWKEFKELSKDNHGLNVITEYFRDSGRQETNYHSSLSLHRQFSDPQR